MTALLGSSLTVFLILTVLLFGLGAWLTGTAVANGWRPAWQALAYAALLAVVDRFLIYALFDGPLFHATGFLIHGAAIAAIALLAFRLTQTRRMVAQYPWLYRAASPVHWVEIDTQERPRP